MKKEEDEDHFSSDNSAISENPEFSNKSNNNLKDSEELKNNENNKNNINEEESRKSYNSLFSFSVFSRNGDDNLIFTNKVNEGFNIIEEKLSEENIRTSDIINKISIWESIKQQLTNFKNQIIFNYNIFTGLTNLNLNSPKLPKEIQIFDEKYSKQDEQLISILKNIPWFSYRKDFEQIKEKEVIYTSDAGWGCMIRASQMILSQGIYKLFSIKDLATFINEYISYFYDNKIPIKLLNKSKSDNNSKSESFQKKEEKKNKINGEDNDELYDDFLIINEKKESRMSFIDISLEMIKGLENMSDRNSNRKYITSPFSIRNYIKIEKLLNPYGKKVGEYFSNYDVIKLITNINEKMFEEDDCDFRVINFDDGTIYVEDLINKCFEEIENSNEVNNDNGFEFISLNNNEKKEELVKYNINNNFKNDIYIFDKKRYKFKHKFILFVSVRHGLYTLDNELYDEILNIFNIKTNIGLIGGKNSRAFYFIGRCDTNLIFLDPHYVQPTIPLTIFGTDLIHESYRPNDIYYMPINDLSPSFSIGFAIKDMKSFKMFMEKMTSPDYYIDQNLKKSFGIKKINLFMVKDYHLKSINDDNEDISNNVQIKENYY